MNKFTLVAFTLLLSGCASQSQGTRDFFVQEQRIVDTCMAPSRQLSPGAALAVDPKTGRSPNTLGAICYANQARAAAAMMQYKNYGAVEQYGRYTVELADSRDRGFITQDAALASHAQLTTLYRQAISSGDAQRAAAARTELADKLAAFAAAYANASAEQQKQQQTNRPAVCSLTGIYRTSGIVCN